MAEKMFSTRFKLRYDTAANWANIESTFIPLAGEVCIYEITEAVTDAKGIVVKPPVTLIKVGDGTTTVGALDYLYAKAADVYAWAKKEQIDIEAVGDGNVISKVEWDAEKGGLKYTTASVATSEGMAAIQKDIADNRAIWAKDTTYTFVKNGKTLTITSNDGEATPITFEYLTPEEVEDLITLKSITGKEAIKVETTNKAAVAELVIDSNAGNVVLSQSDAGLKAEVNLSAYAKTAEVPAIKVNNAGTADKVNHALTIGGKTFDGSETVDVTASDLGISGAMHFVGTSTTDPDTGSVTISGKENYTPALGDVVLYNDKEFVYSSNGWEELGDESSHALKTVKVEAGTGLEGGGTLEADRTISHTGYFTNGASNTEDNNLTNGGNFEVQTVSVDTDNLGHITGYTTTKVVLPSYDVDVTEETVAETAKVDLRANNTVIDTFKIKSGNTEALKISVGENNEITLSAPTQKEYSINGTDNSIVHYVDNQIERAIQFTETDTVTPTIDNNKATFDVKVKENGGLAVDAEAGLKIDDTMIFVFDGGSATIRTEMGESSTGADPV